MPRKLTLSPTRIAAYLECAVKYRYIYIDRIGRFYLRATPGYSFGSTLHHVLQSFHEEARQHGSPPSLERVTETLHAKWVAAGYDSPDQEADYRLAGLQIVESYHAAAAERVLSQVETLFTEKTLSLDMGLFRLQGRIDRIDRHSDGTLEIVDYKSGRLDTSAEEVKESLALSVYQLLLRHAYPGSRVIATVHALRSGTTASAELTDEDAERFAVDIKLLGEEIVSRDFSEVMPARIPACAECEFLRRCENYWRWERRMELET